jgi:serine/threonine protein kinase
MTPERWRQITGIFNGAVAISDSDAREAYLLAACGEDPSLRSEIDSLIAAHLDSESGLGAQVLPDPGKRNRLATGTMLGPYRVEQLLGAGGMGEVYRAHDPRLGRTVALKILPTHLRANPHLLTRFEREARAVALLNHPHICTLHDIGRHDDIDYLVMEFVDGETLSHKLQHGPLAIERAIALTREVAEALAAAHAKGIIHRDIKPSNIIVTPAGHAKVVDFGLARESSLFHSADTTQEDQTEPGMRVGTPYYMSPEQALGEPLDARTDLFSLGIVMFECLTTERPFEGKTRSTYLQNVLAGSVRPVTSLRPEVPAGLEALIAHCLERDASKRLDSASWLASELDALTETRQPRTVRRWTRGAAAAVVLATAAAAATYVSWRQAQTASDAGIAQLRRFTTSPGDETDSHLSPDGTWMSFIAVRQGQRRLYAQPVDGDEARQVTLPPGELQSHIWSPDQKEYACLIWRNQSWVVHLVSGVLGSDVPRQSLPLPPIPRNALLLRWVGKTIYMQVEESTQPPSLRTLDLATGRLDVIAGPWTSMRVRSFDVRPDGRRVVWSATATGTPRDDLWVADLPAGTARQVTDTGDASRKRFPLWRGADDTVIYQSARGGQVDLWELDVASGRSVRLTTDPGIEEPDSTSRDGSISYQLTTDRTTLFMWRAGDDRGVQASNDGLSDFAPHASQNGRVAFQRSQASPVEGFLQTDSDIVLADISTAAGVSGAAKVATGFAPRLSPDGRYVAYLQRGSTPSPGTNLIVMNAETRVATHLSSAMTIPPNHPFPVTWSDQTFAWMSNDELYFVERTTQPMGSRIVRHRLDGSPEPVASTQSRDRISDLYPSLDGRTIAYLTRESSGDGDRVNYHLHFVDVTTGTQRIVANLGSRFVTRLRGWLADGRVALARSVALEPGQTWTFELVTVSPQGDVRVARTVNHVVSLSHLSPKLSELYFTRRVAGVANLAAYSFATDKERQLTDNAAIDVTFGGAALLGSDQTIGIRHEQASDIHLLDVRSRSAGTATAAPQPR